MTGVRSILVPLDGSPLTEQALSGATALAERLRSEVILLHILHIPVPTPPVSHPEMCAGWKRVALGCARRKAEMYLDAQQRQVRQRGIETRTMMCDRAPVEGILDVAIRERVDLIVMNQHVRERWSRWHVENIVGKVARQSPCPVLLVPTAAPGARG